MALSSEKIEAIRRGVDIVRVVGSYIDLKKKGARHMGVCPFHHEKTPSFSVSADKGLYYCFGCHAGGDVFSFVMRHQGLEFHEAARRLAKDAGVELEPESPAVRQRRQREEEIAKANDYALAFFEHALTERGGQRARAYLSERGVPAEMARSWRLGFGGGSGELLGYLKAKNIPLAKAQAAGFVTEDGRRGLFDGRVIFPIFDATKRLCGFGGRRLGEEGPKYVNTRESELFSKRRLLFGWSQAESAVRRSKRAVLVEGFMDVIACHSAGVPNTVAALGTAFTDDHAKALGRIAKEVVLLFDGDNAGQAASREAAERLLAAKIKTLVAPLAAGHDPDSLVRDEGAAALVQLTADARSAVEHFIERSFADAGASVEDKVAAASALAPLIAALGTGLERDLYMARLAERVGVTVDQLAEHLRRTAPKPKKRRQPPAETAGESPAPQAAVPIPERWELRALSELLLHQGLRPRLAELAEYASDPMRALLDELAASTDPFGEVIGRHLPEGSARTALVARAQGRAPEAMTAEEAEELADRTFEDILRRFKEHHLDATKAQMVKEMQDAEARGEDLEEHLRRIQNLTRRKRELKGPRTST